MTVRQALIADAESINKVRVAAWKAAYSGILPQAYLDALDPAANLESLRSRLERQAPGFRAHVAESDGVVSGFAFFGEPRYDTGNGVIELWALNVDPPSWGRGIGSQLLESAKATAMLTGASSMELWVISANSRAIHRYKQGGFTIRGPERSSSALTGCPIHEVLYGCEFGL